MDVKKGEQAERNLKMSFFKAVKSFGFNMPMLVSIVLLIGLFKTFVTPEMISTVFTGNLLTDSLWGAGIGSVSAGSPITSYIIGGELIKENACGVYNVGTYFKSMYELAIATNKHVVPATGKFYDAMPTDVSMDLSKLEKLI